MREGNAVADFYSTDYRPQLLTRFGRILQRCGEALHVVSVWLIPNGQTRSSGGYPEYGTCSPHAPELGDLRTADTVTDIEAQLRRRFRDSEVACRRVAEDLFAFSRQIVVGDFIATYDQNHGC